MYLIELKIIELIKQKLLGNTSLNIYFDSAIATLQDPNPRSIKPKATQRTERWYTV